MPIYEYQCESCQEIIEAWQSLKDAPLTTCPSCAGSMKKLISMSSFQLKGGGWYADGYGNGGKKAGTTPTPAAASTTTPAPAEAGAKTPTATPPACPKKEGSTCSCS